MIHKKLFFFCMLFLGVCAWSAGPVHAGDPKLPINDEAYAARYVSQSLPDPIVIEAGATKTIDFTFKNVGSAIWDASGYRYISAYTVEPKYRDSVFSGNTWLGKNQTAKIQGIVQPGEVGRLSLTLTAPEKVGEYVERFYLAAENRTWMQGGYFYAKITVVPKKETAPSEAATESAENLKNTEDAEESIAIIRAKKIGQSKKQVSVAGGEQVSLVLIYQNAGSTAWNEYQLGLSAGSQLASLGSFSFADAKWHSADIVEVGTEAIAPSDFLRERFTFRAPEKKGEYQATFYLAQNGEIIEGSEAVVDVTVTSDAPDHYTPPVVSSEPTVQPKAKTYRLASEPKIRVGLWKMQSGYVLFKSTQDDYKIYTGSTYRGVLPLNTQATIKQKGGMYSLKAGDIFIESDEYIRLEPKNNPHAVFTLVNYERKVTWKGPRNFNTYRGGMEYRRTDDGNDNLYVINYLLFEDYVAGIAENSNNSPMEYLKAQATAQRSYAYYIAEHSGKHDTRHFDVKATTADQLYLGYESELIMPRFVEAAQATRGYMATYDVDDSEATPNEVVITPYFARTSGRTKSWAEVWGGNRPWLVSVRAEYDAQQGRSLLGHGVGMSQIDASLRAKEEGLSWDALVRYYYTGVDLEQLYK